MHESKLQINQGLSIRYERHKSTIKVGLTAPLAFTIENPPVYLEEILKILSVPHTMREVIQKLRHKYSTLVIEEAENVINDLVKLNLVYH